MARNEFFERIRDSMEEFLDDLRQGRPLRVTEVEIPDPPKPMTAGEIVRLRKDKLKVSQALFAQLLNTAPQTVHAWEQGRNRPSGIALRFLRLVEGRPELLGYRRTKPRMVVLTGRGAKKLRTVRPQAEAGTAKRTRKEVVPDQPRRLPLNGRKLRASAQ